MRRSLVILLAFLPAVAHSNEEPRGKIDMTKWKDTPCVSGRLASQDDVNQGKAAFYLSGDRSQLKPITITLPACAIHHNAQSKKDTPVILIQAEETPKFKAIGFRYLTGGYGVCTLAELEILTGPDNRFE